MTATPRVALKSTPESLDTTATATVGALPLDESKISIAAAATTTTTTTTTTGTIARTSSSNDTNRRGRRQAPPLPSSSVRLGSQQHRVPPSTTSSSSSSFPNAQEDAIADVDNDSDEDLEQELNHILGIHDTSENVSLSLSTPRTHEDDHATTRHMADLLESQEEEQKEEQQQPPPPKLLYTSLKQDSLPYAQRYDAPSPKQPTPREQQKEEAKSEDSEPMDDEVLRMESASPPTPTYPTRTSPTTTTTTSKATASKPSSTTPSQPPPSLPVRTPKAINKDKAPPPLATTTTTTTPESKMEKGLVRDNHKVSSIPSPSLSSNRNNNSNNKTGPRRRATPLSSSLSSWDEENRNHNGEGNNSCPSLLRKSQSMADGSSSSSSSLGTRSLGLQRRNSSTTALSSSSASFRKSPSLADTTEEDKDSHTAGTCHPNNNHRNNISFSFRGLWQLLLSSKSNYMPGRSHQTTTTTPSRRPPGGQCGGTAFHNGTPHSDDSQAKGGHYKSPRVVEKDNSTPQMTRTGMALRGIVLLFAVWMVWDSHAQVRGASETLDFYRREEARLTRETKRVQQEAAVMGQQVTLLQRENAQLEQEYNTRLQSTVSADNNNNDKSELDLNRQQEELREQKLMVRQQVQDLQQRIQSHSRREVEELYYGGKSTLYARPPPPIVVEFVVELPTNTLGRFRVEMAPLSLMPHAVHVFLEQVRQSLWDGCAFVWNPSHLLLAAPSSSTKEEAFAASGHLQLSFLEYSKHYPHRPYTLGFAGRPMAGPHFYINSKDNTLLHGPEADDEDADPCFARVVSGFEVVDQMRAMPTVDKGDSKSAAALQHPIVIQSVRVVSAPHNQW